MLLLSKHFCMLIYYETIYSQALKLSKYYYAPMNDYNIVANTVANLFDFTAINA